MTTLDPPPFDRGEVRWGVTPTARIPLPPGVGGLERTITCIRGRFREGRRVCPGGVRAVSPSWMWGRSS